MRPGSQPGRFIFYVDASSLFLNRTPGTLQFMRLAAGCLVFTPSGPVLNDYRYIVSAFGVCETHELLHLIGDG